MILLTFPKRGGKVVASREPISSRHHRLSQSPYPACIVIVTAYMTVCESDGGGGGKYLGGGAAGGVGLAPARASSALPPLLPAQASARGEALVFTALEDGETDPLSFSHPGPPSQEPRSDAGIGELIVRWGGLNSPIIF
jgi:hypothetical protein